MFYKILSTLPSPYLLVDVGGVVGLILFCLQNQDISPSASLFTPKRLVLPFCVFCSPRDYVFQRLPLQVVHTLTNPFPAVPGLTQAFTISRLTGTVFPVLSWTKEAPSPSLQKLFSCYPQCVQTLPWGLGVVPPRLISGVRVWESEARRVLGLGSQLPWWGGRGAESFCS